MDDLDLLDDVCDRCRHSLDPDGVCPSCEWVRPRDEGPHLPRDRGEHLPGIGGW